MPGGAAAKERHLASFCCSLELPSCFSILKEAEVAGLSAIPHKAAKELSDSLQELREWICLISAPMTL